MARDPRLDAEGQTYLTNVMTLGKATDLPIVLSAYELAKLIGVIYKDTDRVDKLPELLANTIVPAQGYYEMDADWFAKPFDFPPHTAVGALDSLVDALDGRERFPVKPGMTKLGCRCYSRNDGRGAESQGRHARHRHGTPCHYTTPPPPSLPPHSYDLTPTTSLLRPHSYDLTPHSSLLRPHSYDLTPAPAPPVPADTSGLAVARRCRLCR